MVMKSTDSSNDWGYSNKHVSFRISTNRLCLVILILRSQNSLELVLIHEWFAIPIRVSFSNACSLNFVRQTPVTIADGMSEFVKHFDYDVCQLCGFRNCLISNKSVSKYLIVLLGVFGKPWQEHFISFCYGDCYVLDRLNADSCNKVHGNFWCEGIKCESTRSKMLSINDIFITLNLTVFPLTTKMSCHVIHHETCLNKVISRPMRILNMLLSCFEFFCLKYLWSEVCLFGRTLLP